MVKRQLLRPWFSDYINDESIIENDDIDEIYLLV